MSRHLWPPLALAALALALTVSSASACGPGVKDVPLAAACAAPHGQRIRVTGTLALPSSFVCTHLGGASRCLLTLTDATGSELAVAIAQRPGAHAMPPIVDTLSEAAVDVRGADPDSARFGVGDRVALEGVVAPKDAFAPCRLEVSQVRAAPSP